MACRYSKIFCLCALYLCAGCSRTSNQTWEDVKTAGRYMQKSFDALFGKEYESRLLTSEDEFIGPYENEFIPLKDADLCSTDKIADTPIPQPKGIPGEKGFPSLSEFFLPPESIRNLFLSAHFDTADHTLKNKAEVEALQKLAHYLQQHPDILLTVEGHCDERGAADYNMGLGMRRANTIRSLLVKYGVDPNRIFTVTRGKEQPVALGHTPQDWKLNRRTEYKIYHK